MRVRYWIRYLLYTVWGRIKAFFSVSLYRYGEVLCQASALIFVLLVITVIWKPLGTGSIIREVSNPAIFDQSLSLILNFMSVIFLLVIFLIQNANQEYSQRLSVLIFKDKYLIGILIFILGFSAFNLTGLYLGWTSPFDLISYVLSIIAVLLIGAIILFTGYFLSISNIVDYVTDRMLRKIEPRNIYSTWRPLVPDHDEEFTEDLVKDVHLLFSTGSRAIEEDQREVFESTLDSISEVSDRYLEQTSGEITNDDFVNEIADYFEFLIKTALEDDSRQKYLDDIAEAMSDIALSIVDHRDMGGQSQMVGRLLKSIKDLFYRSYGLDLTSVGHVCIDKIDEVSVAALEDGDYSTYDYYNSHLDDIADICAEAKQYYSALLLQRALNKYQWQYVKLVQLLLDEKLAVEEWQIRDFFDDLSSRFNEATSEASHSQEQLIYAALYGANSFNWKLKKADIQGIENPRIERLTKEYLEEYIDFHHRILTTDIGNNHIFAYSAFPEMLYLVSHNIELSDKFESELVKQINDNWLDYIRQYHQYCIEEDEGVYSKVEESMMDYYALLIFFHRGDEELLQEFTEDLVSIYNDLPKNQDSRWGDAVNRSLYKQLKLYGCWLSLSYRLEEAFPTLFDVLVADFQEVEHPGKALPTSVTEKYGYPYQHGTGRYGPWLMSPSQVWGNQVQYGVSAEMNQMFEDDYQLFYDSLEETDLKERPQEQPYRWFHFNLKTRHDIRSAVSQGAALREYLSHGENIR